MECGNVTLFNTSQPWNTSLPNSVNELLLAKVTVVRLLQSANALVPIDFTVLGMDTEVISLSYANAHSSIPTTLYSIKHPSIT